ncbi:hypothetical protein [Actinotalea sp. K2]|uniref:hypothetical protein n=1 Tax=Actinotalea sp. K2 TaxID=2939438 RepID=UPI002016B65F|nr:hypothetical protein [Actinotalea sp. K2]MCL3862733.1 hypothetical protein [Actinotalea sp. K2]
MLTPVGQSPGNLRQRRSSKVGLHGPYGFQLELAHHVHSRSMMSAPLPLDDVGADRRRALVHAMRTRQPQWPGPATAYSGGYQVLAGGPRRSLGWHLTHHLETPVRLLVTGGARFIGSNFVHQTVRERAAQLGTVVAHRQVIDGRNALDPVRWRAAGWTYTGLGRP